MTIVTLATLPLGFLFLQSKGLVDKYMIQPTVSMGTASKDTYNIITVFFKKDHYFWQPQGFQQNRDQ